MVSIQVSSFLFLVLCGCVSSAYETFDFDFKKCGQVIVDKAGAIVTVENKNKEKEQSCKLDFHSKLKDAKITLLIEELETKCESSDVDVQIKDKKSTAVCGNWNIGALSDVKVEMKSKDRNMFNETVADEDVTVNITKGQDFTKMRIIANLERAAETCDSDFTCTTKGKTQYCINADLKCNSHFDCSNKLGADEENCGLGTVAIVGIVVGVIAGILIIGGAVYVFILKKK